MKKDKRRTGKGDDDNFINFYALSDDADGPSDADPDGHSDDDDDDRGDADHR